MVTSQDIQAEMQRVQRVREQAQAEERARLARENANQRTVQEADAELHRLGVDYHQQKFAEGVAANNQLVAESDRAVDAMQSKLDDFIAGRCALSDVHPFVQAVDRLWNQQKQHREAALSHAGNLQGMPPAGTRLDANSPEALFGFGPSYIQQLEPVLSVYYALLDWIAKARNADDDRVRQGIAYAIAGQNGMVPSINRNQPTLPNRDTLRAELKNNLSPHFG